jgi:hypothetical protein
MRRLTARRIGQAADFGGNEDEAALRKRMRMSVGVT